LSPVESVDYVVLITDVPGILPDEAAELNTTQEKRENEKNRQNAEDNFTSAGRKYDTAQKRLCDHSLKNEKDETRFDSFKQFVFETAFRPIAIRHARIVDGRRKGVESGRREFDYGVRL
jgi:hypothetical protein